MTAPLTEPVRRVAVERPVSWRGSRVRSQILVLTARSVRALVLDPKLIVVSLLVPLIMLLMFSQIFASVADTPGFPAGVGYVDFLVPAIMVNAAMQSALHTGFGLTHDIRNGIVARFRSLPIWLGSVLLARSLADLARSGIQLAGLLVFAYALFGFRPGGGLTGVLAAWGLGVIVGGGVGWIFIALACWIRKVEVMEGTTVLVMVPLMFASHAFVPMNGLPDWLRTVAALNPMTYGVQAARDLTLGEPAGLGALAAVTISLITAGLAIPIAIRGFRRPL